MKIPQLILAVALIVAFAHGAAGLAQSVLASDQDLLKMPIDNLELEAANIHLLLSKLSTQKRVPIGLEVSPYDDLSQTKTIRLEIKHGTLADALKSIVEQNPLYTWTIQDEVVNVRPIDANRDPLLRDVLKVKLGKISIPPSMSRFTARQTLSTTPEVRAVLTVLNQVIRESQTKYWIVLRSGEKKQYFVLNL